MLSVELLASDGPGVLAEQQMEERRAGNRGGVRFELLAVDRDGAAVDVDDVDLGSDSDVISH